MGGQVEWRRFMADLATLSNSLKDSLASLDAELTAIERELEIVDLDNVIEVEGTIPIDQERDQTGDQMVVFESRLAYGLREQRRRLLVRSYQTDDPDTELEYVDESDTPLHEAPALLRIAAVESGALDELLELVRRRTETLSNDARKAAMRLASARASS
jgi:hypothetical protein